MFVVFVRLVIALTELCARGCLLLLRSDLPGIPKKMSHKKNAQEVSGEQMAERAT